MLDAPERPRGTRKDRADQGTGRREARREETGRGLVEPSYRRDFPEDFLDFDQTPFDAEQNPARRRRSLPLRIRVARLVPRSLLGKAALVVGILVGGTALAFGWYQARLAVLHDSRFVIPSSEAIEIAGNSRLSRGQVISIFGDDVDRNIWKVPLEERRSQLEAVPWVEHATVMRLLPNHLRVAVTERTPLAFVQDGGQIGLVDGSGVLLELQPGQSSKDYSFPVLVGVSASDPLATRNARMKMFVRFTQELDAGAAKGKEPSRELSEVDLSDPEDIKATREEDGRSILIHFGDHDFLARWRRFMQNLPEWEKQYPKLVSADLQYEHEVVLHMAGGAVTPGSGGTVGSGEAAAAPVAPPVAKVSAPSVPAKVVPAKARASKVVSPAKGKTKPKPIPAKTKSARTAQRKGAQP